MSEDNERTETKASLTEAWFAGWAAAKAGAKRRYPDGLSPTAGWEWERGFDDFGRDGWRGGRREGWNSEELEGVGGLSKFMLREGFEPR